MNAQRERVVRQRRAGGAAVASAAGGTAASAQGTVHGAIADLPRGRWLLAVSGGRDSMVLLHAMARARAGEIAAVATFDHGTGTHARRAAALVEREAEALGLRCVTGAAAPGLPFNEGAWRAARHGFLDAWAAEFGATVVTAHTRDDEIETVVQRLLREAGPRGLAGMRAAVFASEGIGLRPEARRARPLLTVPRATIADYAAAMRIRWVEDPGNASLRFQRNRIRHELLPALERVRPGFGAWCWAIGARAARWRAQLEALVDAVGVTVPAAGRAVVPAAPLRACGRAEWAVLWPAIAARAGVVMDRRGIARAAEWAPHARAGAFIPLSGAARIVRTAGTFVVHGNA